MRLWTTILLGQLATAAMSWAADPMQPSRARGQVPAEAHRDSIARCAPRTITVLEPPGKELRPSIGSGRPVLINGRFLTPAGRTALAQSYSWAMALSADESTAVLLSRNAFQVISTAEPKVVDRFPAFGQKAPKWLEDGAYMGCAFSPDSQKLYLGSANHGEIVVYDLKTRSDVDRIDINGNGYEDSFLGDFLLSNDGTFLYGVDQFNYRMVVVDLGRRRLIRSVRVGRNPFGICLSPDGKYAWVSNVGMFEYPLLPGVTPKSEPTAGLSFPAYGVPSKESEEGVVAEGKKIPGLGSPNHPDAMSVFKVELETGRVEAKIKTGYLVGQRRGDINTIGGASPSTVVAGKRFAYVSNATNDTISIIDVRRNGIVDQVELLVPGLETLRGVLPFSIALSPDEQSLYVACAGLNAVAVVDLERRRLAGYIPAGWFCSLVHVSRDGKRLFVYSAKGVGSGPNGGRDFVTPARGSHPGDIMQGLFQVIDVPDAARLADFTRQVVANTYRKREVVDDGRNPLPPAPRLRPSPIRHIVFIVKENRTFDQVFGERKNVAGDPTLAGLGCHVTVVNKAGAKVQDVNVAPNHQALADRFALCDNFYCDSDQSNTGHRWVVGVYPNEWVEVNARSRIEARLFSSAPGRRSVAGSAAGVFPEDYNEAGALWEHLDRHRVPFFNFGFGTEMPASIEQQIHKYTGMQMRVSIPLPKPLLDNTSRKFATFNMHIPDQFRVDMFEEEYREKWASGREKFPRLITMVLPNDHLTDESPATGYPFKESYLADNDLALARVVRFLSRTPYWKNMLIIVTEDDPQGGRDHIDAHRSLLLLISPYVKRGSVSSTLLNFGSIMKMIFSLLDLPCLNHFDATATMPDDCFSDQPDFTPYAPKPVDGRLFDPAKAWKPFDRGFDWSRLLDSPAMDDPRDMQRGFQQEDRRSQSHRLPEQCVVQAVSGYNSWPMIQAIGETLVCVYSRGTAHTIGEDARAVYARTSGDNGRTWTTETVVANTPRYGEVAVGKGLDSTGAMLLWVRRIGPDWNHDLYRTTDGVTFTRLATPKLAVTPMQITDIFVVPKVGLMALWFAGRYDDSPSHSWGTLTSRDNGATWAQRTIESKLTKSQWPTEPSAVYLDNGRILAVARTEMGGTSQFQLVSTDYGETWARKQTNIGDVAASTPSLILDPETRLLSNYYYQRGKGILRRRVADPDSVFSNPLNWPASEEVATGSPITFDAGNANATAISGTHFVAFYSGKAPDTAILVSVLPAPTAGNSVFSPSRPRGPRK